MFREALLLPTHHAPCAHVSGSPSHGIGTKFPRAWGLPCVLACFLLAPSSDTHVWSSSVLSGHVPFFPLFSVYVFVVWGSRCLLVSSRKVGFWFFCLFSLLFWDHFQEEKCLYCAILKMKFKWHSERVCAHSSDRLPRGTAQQHLLPRSGPPAALCRHSGKTGASRLRHTTA